MKIAYILMLSVLSWFTSLVAQAQCLHDHEHIPHRAITNTITQPSGEHIVLSRVSDEHRVVWLTAEGAPTWYDEATHTLRYALLLPDLTLQHTSQAVSSVPSDVARQAVASMRHWHTPVATRVAATQAQASVVGKGSPRIPVLLVEFTDTTFQPFNTRLAIDSMLNAEDYTYRDGNGSVQAYFKAQSDGQFTPQFDVYGPYRLANTMKYYGENVGISLDIRWRDMVNEAIALAVAEGVDFNVYKDARGSIPHVSVIFAGQGEHVSSSKHTNRLYPKMLAQTFTVSGHTFRSKLISDEAYYTNDSTAYRAGTGTFIHEFGHALGLPDFYDTGSAGSYGMDIWSVMDLGMHYNNRYRPIGFTAYEREYMGWINVPTLTDPAEVRLRPLHEATGEGERAVKIVNPHDANEYFVLENRQSSSYFPSILGQGLMITHVYYDAGAWSGNRVNRDKNKQRMYVVPADNEQKGYEQALLLRRTQPIDTALKSLRNDFFPGVSGTYTTFTTSSVRPMRVYNSDGSGTPGLLDKPIYNIRVHADRTLTFAYLDSTVTHVRTATAEQQTATTSHFYTLEGIHVATLPADASPTMLHLPRGIYIRVAGTQREKIIIE